MLKAFFDTRPVDDFATQISAEVFKALPPGLVQGDSKGALRKREQLDERLRRKIERLVATHSLNFYQKAKLGTALQDKLEQKGYAAAFARSFSSDTVKLVALVASRR